MPIRRSLLALGAALLVAVTAGVPPQEPEQVSASGVASVSAGSEFTCALSTSGGVKCWGANDFGQLGHGVTGGFSGTPVDVVGLTSGVAAISAYFRHTCALTTAGGVKCWGINDYGELGAGTTSGPQLCSFVCSSTPVDVVGLSNGVAAVSAGMDHTCAVTTAGAVKCWGASELGQLGAGTITGSETCRGQFGTTTCSTTPVDVEGLTSGIAAVSAGDAHTCALTTAGGIKCWGDNLRGQLGEGTSSGPETCTWLGLNLPCSTTPRDVSGLKNGATAVSAGYTYTCALTPAGGVKCWGINGYGQLGDGTTTGPETCPIPTPSPCSTTPVDVMGLTSDVASLSAGEDHACVVTTTGGVKCWGVNSTGELGDGTMADRDAPVDVVGLANGVASVSAGGDRTCALTTVGDVKCWGAGSGNRPVDVVGLTPDPGDVNCDGATNSIDAAVILQHAAGLLPVLGCQEAADTNHDAHIDAIDAALILQFSAGLLTSFVPWVR